MGIDGPLLDRCVHLVGALVAPERPHDACIEVGDAGHDLASDTGIPVQSALGGMLDAAHRGLAGFLDLFGSVLDVIPDHLMSLLIRGSLDATLRPRCNAGQRTCWSPSKDVFEIDDVGVWLPFASDSRSSASMGTDDQEGHVLRNELVTPRALGKGRLKI